MVQWASIGVLLKAASWPLGFIFLAKGDSNIFLISETVGNIYFLLLNILGYSIWGLDGLGISYLLAYFLLLIQVYAIAKIRFEFTLGLSFLKILVAQIAFAAASFMIVQFNFLVTVVSGIIIFLLSSAYSLWCLNKRIPIFAIVKSKFRK
jgi:O-antigen/teichoic acid export membrane protein